MALIRGNSVLPARRSQLALETADGVKLVAELALPEASDPVATLVCLHPLPTHGGMMDSHIFRKASYRLPALADVAVLRFNTRGTWSQQGTSEGTFDAANAERYDVAAALEYADYHDLPNVWLLGWSFGTDLALKFGLDPLVRGAILLSPPLRYTTPEELTRWAESGKPVTALVPEHDEFLPPDQARAAFEPLPQLELVVVSGAQHLWVGDAERVLDEVVARVVPGGKGPLPTDWSGPMSRADMSVYNAHNLAAYRDATGEALGQ